MYYIIISVPYTVLKYISASVYLAFQYRILYGNIYQSLYYIIISVFCIGLYADPYIYSRVFLVSHSFFILPKPSFLLQTVQQTFDRQYFVCLVKFGLLLHHLSLLLQILFLFLIFSLCRFYVTIL